MTSTMIQPAGEYFARPAQRRQQDNEITTYGWDPVAYTDPTLVTSDSCDSSLPSPTSADTVVFPPSSYTLPKQEFASRNKNDQAFNFGAFEDWMRWDDPSDAALSPTSDFFPEFKVEPVSPSMSGLELQGSGVGNSNLVDEAVVFGDDPLTEEPLFQTPNPLIATPMNETQGLYSTPLAWSRPTPGPRRSHTYAGSSTLSPEQESKLRNIAMPSQTYPGSPSSSSSPEASAQTRKRKSSIDEDEEQDHDQEQDDDESPPPANGRHPPVKKTAHNMIEKRYRTNLNDKIAALRDSVPSLRVMSKKNTRGDEVQEDLQGLAPAHKLNKATVLSKATEYIAHLEKRNKYLMKENSSLKSRVDAFEILVMSRQGPPKMQPGQMGMQQQQQRVMGRQMQGRSFGGLEGMSGMM